MTTAREVAAAWMAEHCAAADGPRMTANDDPVPGEPHCDCLESLTRLIERERARPTPAPAGGKKGP